MTVKSAAIGPFDQRVRKSRCQHCSKSHLKCSGQKPCRNCFRKHLLCTYSLTSLPVVTLNKDKVLAFNPRPTDSEVVSSSPTDRQSFAFKSFLNIFLRKNIFTGKEDDWDYVRSRLADSEALTYTAQAIGLLCNKDSSHTLDQDSVTEALEAYTLANASLRTQIASASGEDWVHIMESTLFMGLFELMYAENAGGWRRHFIYGTREVLMRLGPESCASGAGKQFFLRFRMFEITSSIIFGYRTFLATEPWLDLLEHVWPDSTFMSRNLKERMLDLCTICSDLCQRAADFMFSLPEAPTLEAIEHIKAVAMEGIRMRLLLSKWQKSVDNHNVGVTSDEMIIAQVMYHSISLYLHNTFEVNPRWKELDVVTPTLHSAIVKSHIDETIDYTSHAISSTNLCAIIFSFPLWVAGNTATSEDQRERIINLYNTMKLRYSAAQISIWNLSETWKRDEIFRRHDCPYPVMKHHRFGLLGHLRSEIPNPRAAHLYES